MVELFTTRIKQIKRLIYVKSSDQQMVQTGDQTNYKGNSKQINIYKTF